MWTVYVNLLANLIIKQYFTNSRCLFIFSSSFTYTGEIPFLVLNPSTNFGHLFGNFSCQGLVIIAENPTPILLAFEEQIRLQSNRFNNRKYLVVQATKNDNFQVELFEQEALNFIADLLVVVRLKQDSFGLKTHQFGGFETRRAILLDIWCAGNQSYQLNANLYPDKLRNQQGRALRMATFSYEPYSVVGNTPQEHHGSELSLAVQFGLKYNLTPMPIVNEEDYWGEIYPNWSGKGLLGNLVADRADIGFAALYTWELCYGFLDLSKPLVRTGITCLVPAPRLAAGWLTPLYSYSLPLWICVGCVFVAVVATLSLVLFCYNRNSTMKTVYDVKKIKPIENLLNTALLVVTKPLLLQAVTKKEAPRELTARLMIVLTEMLGLFLTSTYCSGLSTVMTVPRFDNAIDTVGQLAESGLNWGATQEAWITSIQTAEEDSYVKIVKNFHAISEEQLRENSKNGKWGFSIERLPFENYAIGSYIQEDVIKDYHLMGQDLYWEHCVMMLRKSSVLLPLLDLFILKAFEAGLISKWQSTAVDLFMNPNVQKAVKYYKHHISEHRVVKLKWSHVEGAFAALLLGYCISFVLFIIELFYFHRNRK